jgi:hypothetical protein
VDTLDFTELLGEASSLESICSSYFFNACYSLRFELKLLKCVESPKCCSSYIVGKVCHNNQCSFP